jgi:hypothetical protein
MEYQKMILIPIEKYNHLKSTKNTPKTATMFEEKKPEIEIQSASNSKIKKRKYKSTKKMLEPHVSQGISQLNLNEKWIKL